MSYFAPYLDETGAHVPGYNDILEYIIEKFKSIYGNDIYLDSDSQDYQFLSSLALLYYDCCQTFLLAYSNQSPVTAVGAALDRLCALNGIKRSINSYSLATLNLTGKPYSTISYVQARDINGYIWQLNEDITFGSNGTATVVASCTVPGNITAAPNTITEIATPLKDWYSVTNPLAAVPGSQVEQDSDLREKRAQSVGIASMTQADSLISYLRSLTDANDTSIVGRVIIYENSTGSTVDNIPAHSIAVVVESDSSSEHEQLIGEAIYLKKSPGTSTYKVNDSTYGVSVQVSSSLGIINTINYSRPAYVAANVSITLSAIGTVTTSIIDDIKSNVSKYINDLAIGEDLHVSNLYLPILQANPNSSSPVFYISALTVNGQTTNVTVDAFSVMNCDVSNVSVTVS